MVFKLPGRYASTDAVLGLGQEVGPVVPARKPGNFHLRTAEEDFVPALAPTSRLFDHRPRPIVSLGLDPVEPAAALLLTSKLPVHRVVRDVAVAAVHDLIHAVDALVGIVLDRVGYAGQQARASMAIWSAQDAIGVAARLVGVEDLPDLSR